MRTRDRVSRSVQTLDKALEWGPSSYLGFGSHRYGFVHVCPARKNAGPRCSHRQRQTLPLSQLADQIRPADMFSQNICRVLRHRHAAGRRAAPDFLINGQHRTAHDLRPIALVWLCHAFTVAYVSDKRA